MFVYPAILDTLNMAARLTGIHDSSVLSSTGKTGSDVVTGQPSQNAS